MIKMSHYSRSMLKLSSWRYSQGGWCMTRAAASDLRAHSHDQFSGADDIGLGDMATHRGITMVNSPAWMTEYTKWDPAQLARGRLQKVSIRENGYDEGKPCDLADPRLLANFSVVHTSCINGAALTGACGVKSGFIPTKSGYHHPREDVDHNQKMLLWHSYLFGQGNHGRQGGDWTRCDAVHFS